MAAEPVSEYAAPHRDLVHGHGFHHHPLYRKTLHAMRVAHTYLTMLALVLLVFFSVTGFMLNHAEWFDTGDPVQTTADTVIPREILAAGDKLALVEHLRSEHAIRGAVEPFDLPDASAANEPVQLVFKSPRSQTIVDISWPDGKTQITTETNALAALLMNLHKGKDAPPSWRLLLDATAALLFLGAVSGFVLWYSLPHRRLLGLIGLALSLFVVLGVFFLLIP